MKNLHAKKCHIDKINKKYKKIKMSVKKAVMDQRRYPHIILLHKKTYIDVHLKPYRMFFNHRRQQASDSGKDHQYTRY